MSNSINSLPVYQYTAHEDDDPSMMDDGSGNRGSGVLPLRLLASSKITKLHVGYLVVQRNFS